jgi:HEAT repeat protein
VTLSQKIEGRTGGGVESRTGCDPTARLREPYRAEQERAAEELTALREPQSVQPLISILLYGGGSHAAVLAAYALGEIGDRRAVDSLISVLQRKDLSADVRCRAATALGKIDDTRALDPLVVIVSEWREGWGWSEDRGVRCSAADALGAIGDPRALPALRRMTGTAFSTEEYAAKQAIACIENRRR